MEKIKEIKNFYKKVLVWRKINMETSAHLYMNQYRNLQVPIVNEKEERTGFQKVDVHQYLLAQDKNAGTKGAAADYNITHSSNALDALYGKISSHFAKPGATLKVFVTGAEIKEKTFHSFNDLWYRARKAFWGKASPEEVQITLQLAIRFGLVKPEELQNYCDQSTDGLAQGRIGLDCNGFVGNYLEHGFRGKPWDKEKTGENFLANTGIADIMNKLGPELKDLNDIRILETYVLGLVDKNTNQIINRISQDHKSTGHIMVTTPFTFFGDYITSEKGKIVSQRLLKLIVVESTLDKGLTESDYFLLEGKNKIFKVSRGSKKYTPYEFINVKIRPVL